MSTPRVGMAAASDASTEEVTKGCLFISAQYTDKCLYIQAPPSKHTVSGEVANAGATRLIYSSKNLLERADCGQLVCRGQEERVSAGVA